MTATARPSAPGAGSSVIEATSRAGPLGRYCDYCGDCEICIDAQAQEEDALYLDDIAEATGHGLPMVYDAGFARIEECPPI